jgi:hypothetical protein
MPPLHFKDILQNAPLVVEVLKSMFICYIAQGLATVTEISYHIR